MALHWASPSAAMCSCPSAQLPERPLWAIVLSLDCAPSGVGGIGTNGDKEIGEGRLKVMVPQRLWKAVLVLPREGAEPRKNVRVIAVIMPNDQSVNFD